MLPSAQPTKSRPSATAGLEMDGRPMRKRQAIQPPSEKPISFRQIVRTPKGTLLAMGPQMLRSTDEGKSWKVVPGMRAVPDVDTEEGRYLTTLSDGRVLVTFGYMETPNIPKALGLARKLGWKFDIMSTSFFLSRRSLRLSSKSEMPRWQERMFIALAGSAEDATTYFQIPTDRVVEVGTQVAV